VAVVADAFGPIFLIPLQTRRFTIPGLTAGADVIACRLLSCWYTIGAPRMLRKERS
jgi:hypothetical protein